MLKNGSHVAPLEQHDLADQRITEFVRDRVAR
jgi:hypothetical protein